MLRAGVRWTTEPSMWLLKVTPSSVTRLMSDRLNTWNPPLSVRMGPGQAMNRCKSPKAATTLSPGRSIKWYVLARMICEPVAATWSGRTPLMVPCVPTGMKAGVSKEPWRVWTRPRRAWVRGASERNSSYRSGAAGESGISPGCRRGGRATQDGRVRERVMRASPIRGCSLGEAACATPRRSAAEPRILSPSPALRKLEHVHRSHAFAPSEDEVDCLDPGDAADLRRLLLVGRPASGGAGGERADQLARRGTDADLDLLALPAGADADAGAERRQRAVAEVHPVVTNPIAGAQVADDRLSLAHAALRVVQLGVDPAAGVALRRAGRRRRCWLWLRTGRRTHRWRDASTRSPRSLSVFVRADVRRAPGIPVGPPQVADAHFDAPVDPRRAAAEAVVVCRRVDEHRVDVRVEVANLGRGGVDLSPLAEDVVSEHRPQHVAALARGHAVLHAHQRVVEDLVVTAGGVHLQRVVRVPHDVVVDEVVGAEVVQVDAHAAEAAGAHVVDHVVGELGALAVGAVGVDAAAVGGLEHHVVDLVVRDADVGRAAGLDAVAGGVVDRVAGDVVAAASDQHARVVADGVADVVDDVVLDAV